MPAPRPRPRRPRPWHHATLPLRRLARRIADGVPAQEAAGIEGIDVTQAKELIGERHFSELVASYRALLALPPAERLQRLAKKALFVLEDEIDELRNGAAAAWLLYELGHGREPGMVLAKAVARACEGELRPLRPAKPEPAADSASPAAAAPVTPPAPEPAPLRPPAPPLTGKKYVAARMAAVRRQLTARLLVEAARPSFAADCAPTGVAPAAATDAAAATAASSAARPAASPDVSRPARRPEPRRPGGDRTVQLDAARRFAVRLAASMTHGTTPAASPGRPQGTAAPTPFAGAAWPRAGEKTDRKAWPLGP